MTQKRNTGFRIVGPDVDLEKTVIVDSKGRRVDQAYVDRALAEVEHELSRPVGRPSLTGESRHSPHVTFRITPDLKERAEQAARARGVSVSQLAREALERFLAS